MLLVNRCNAINPFSSSFPSPLTWDQDQADMTMLETNMILCAAYMQNKQTKKKAPRSEPEDVS